MDEGDQRIFELELELRNMKDAFEDYVASSQQLEDGLDTELSDMHGRLANSSDANVNLETQLKNMEPLLRQLEAAVSAGKKKLMEEARLRRQAELAQVEIECRMDENEKEMIKLREEKTEVRVECDALQEELAFKCKELETVQEEKSANIDKLSELENRVESTMQRREEQLFRNSDETTTIRSPRGDARTETTNMDSLMDDSYAEVLDELETVTEQLIQTQQKLWRTEDRLRDSESRVRLLGLQPRESSGETTTILHSPVTSPRHVGFEDRCGGQDNPFIAETEELYQENSKLQTELAFTREEVRVAEENAQACQARLDCIEQNRPEDEMASYRTKLFNIQRELVVYKESAEMNQDLVVEYELVVDETKEENAQLVEEIACLRLLVSERSEKMYGKSILDSLEESAEESSKASSGVQVLNSLPKGKVNQLSEKKIHQKDEELKVLREKFKDIVKQNSILQSRIDELQGGNPLAQSRKEDVKRLREEVSRLKTTLVETNDSHQLALAQRDDSWKEKMQATADDNQGVLDGRYQDLSKSNQILEEKVEDFEQSLMRARQENEIAHQRREEADEKLQSSRDEILRLKKNFGILSTDLKHALNTIERLDKECERVMHQYSVAQAELDVAKQVIQESGLEEDTLILEDTLELKRKVHALTAALERVQKEYGDLEVEFEASRHQFHEDQEVSSKKSNDEIANLHQKVQDLETKLDAFKADHSDISVKLKRAKRDCVEALRAGEKRGRETAATDLKARQSSERKLVMNKFENLTDEKSVLAKQLEETGSTVAGITGNLETATAEIESLRVELRDCKDKISQLHSERDNNKEEISKLESEKDKLLQVLQLAASTDRNIPVTAVDSKEREGMDPEPCYSDDQGTEVVGSFAPPPSIAQAFLRDPPPSRGQLLSAVFDAASKTDNTDLKALRSQLHDLSLENELLREKVVNISSSSDYDMTSPSSRSISHHDDETEKLKEQVQALQVCLEGVEGHSSEIEALESKLREVDHSLQQKEKALHSVEDKLSWTSKENKTLKAEVLALKDAVVLARKQLSAVEAELEESRSKNDEMDRGAKLREKEAADEVRLLLSSERNHDFIDLRHELKKLTEEKSGLQHQLDDSKIALSVSQYAQERNKEDLRASDNKLEKTLDEVNKLRNEISSAEKTISLMERDIKEIEDEAEHTRQQFSNESKSQEHVKSLSTQLHHLSENNTGLQQLVIQLESDLEVSNTEVDQRNSQIHSLESNLAATQEETRLLSEEIEHLSSAFETAKKEYDQVVDELEAVNELFDEARQEAERSGREAATEEIRVEMYATREKERTIMKDQLRKVFEENASLQKKVVAVEASSAKAKEIGEKDPGLASEKEITSLRASLTKATAEANKLKSQELSLSLALKAVNHELKVTQQELQSLTKTVDDNDKKKEQSALSLRSLAIEQVRSEASNEDHQQLRQHLQSLVKQTEADLSAKSNDSTSSHKAEGLKLKVELLDMSMTLEKLMRENSILETELDELKKQLLDARAQGEIAGKAKATKELRTVMRTEREKEMNEFKEKFNELIAENTSLETSLREMQLSQTAHKESIENTRKKVLLLEEELGSARAETKKFQEEVLNLSIELESTSEDHERVVDEIRTSLITERDGKVKALQNQLKAMTLESTAHKAKSTGAPHSEAHASEKEARNLALKRSQEKTARLETELTELKSELERMRSNNLNLSREKIEIHGQVSELKTKLSLMDLSGTDEQNVAALNSQLCSAKKESSDFRAKLAKLNILLDQRSKEYTDLKTKVDEVSQEAEVRGRQAASDEYRQSHQLAESKEVEALKVQMQNLASEKKNLQKEVDDARISLSLSKYTQELQTEEAEILKGQLENQTKELQARKESVSRTGRVLQAAQEEHTMTRVWLDKLSIILDMTDTQDCSDEDSQCIAEKAKEVCSECVVRSADLNEKIKEAEAALLGSQATEAQKELALSSSKEHLASTQAKAQKVQSQIVSLLSTLEKLQAERSSIVTAMESTNVDAASSKNETDRSEIAKQMRTFASDNIKLSKKIDEMENAVKLAKESDRKHKLEVELSEAKVREAKNEANQFREDISKLQDSLSEADKDHKAMRCELESVNAKAQAMCAKAEEKGRLLEAKKLDDDNADKQKDRHELMVQFKVFYDENLVLQKKLEAAENTLKETVLKLKSKEEGDKSAVSLYEQKIETLENVNQRLNEELESLREALDGAKHNRDDVLSELEDIKTRLASVKQDGMNALSPKSQTRSMDGASTTLSERNSAELLVLQQEFQKLTHQSSALGQKMVEAESTVASVKDRQVVAKGNMELQSHKVRELEAVIAHVIENSQLKAEEASQLSVKMETRVATAEQSLGLLETDVATTNGKLKVAEASVLLKKKYGKARGTIDEEQQQEPRRTTLSMDTDLESSASPATESIEAREDEDGAGTATSTLSPPKKEVQSLTSRAMSVFTRSNKKKQQRSSIESKASKEMPAEIEQRAVHQTFDSRNEESTESERE